MKPKVRLCLEQTLGHRTHSANLEAYARGSGHDVDCLPVEYTPGRLPWALRGSWQAYRRVGRAQPADITMYHTQTVALFANMASRGTPYVVSVDATPRQLDTLGHWYDHDVRGGAVESAKLRWYRAVIERATAVVCWSGWAAESIVREYHGDPASILVAHPGAAAAFFDIPLPRPPAAKPTILFVGGDFVRKGGDDLLRAFTPLADDAELVLVTSGDVPPAPGIRVEKGVEPNSQRLLDIFAGADIFCLPTRGDCTPVVLGEAMAAGLPVVTTRIGSNEETVAAGSDGILIDVGDAGGLSEALGTLVEDRSVRARMGASARAHARESFDSQRNAGRIFARLLDIAGARA